MHQRLRTWLLFGYLLAGASMLSSCGAAPTVSEPDGLFRTKTIAAPFFLSRDVEKDFFRYKDYVEAHSQRESAPSRYTALDKAFDIYMVAQDFGIDPNVLLALVRKESAFRIDAESPTHALGLTQFTTIGIQEVHDQLGARGRDYALASTIDYWNRLVPRVYGYLSGGKSFPMPDEETRAASMKQKMTEDPLLAIIYGAILLKTHLASSMANMGQADEDRMPDLYREALENYNGDPPVQEEYAAMILRWASELAL